MSTNQFSPEATEEELEAYREVGYFVRESAFTESELEAFRGAVDGIHDQIVEGAENPEVEPARLIDGRRYQKVLGSSVQWEWRDRELPEIRTMEPYHHLDKRLDALIDDIRLWGPSRAIIDASEVSLFSDKLNFKRPNGAPFPWHQDNPYWAFLCDHLDRLVSVGLILDDSTVENGCLWMIPGSHKFGALPCFEDRGVTGRLYTDVDNLDIGAPTPIDAPAGSIIFFHGDIVHGSQGNRSNVDRRVLLITYQPAGLARWQRDDVRPIRAA